MEHRLHNYTLHREIGRGGMAAVYEAHDDRHDRTVAIKVLSPQVAAALAGERFEREIQTLARLQHPHILPLFDSGLHEGTLYFVMPLVEGRSLRDRISAGRCALTETVRLVRQVADALDYAHERGVVHRDVKPENILLHAGYALVADFGIAKVLSSVRASEPDPEATVDGSVLTEVGVSLGTPTYMSPEQAYGEQVDARADVYALGCVAFEMLAGEPPFSAATGLALIAKHLTAPPPALPVDIDAPSAVNAAIQRALSKQPDNRFSTAGAFAAALEQASVAPATASDKRLALVEQAQRERRVVLVLDFANISAVADADWLTLGLAESVSADLRQIEGVRVVTPTAAQRARAPSSMDPASALEMGKVAGARWVIWGGFQKMGARIRLTAYVGDVESAAVTALEKIDGVIDEIFALQDQLITAFAHTLRIRLSSDEIARIERPETRTLTAYEHYAKGLQAWKRMGKSSSEEAANQFERAIAIDSEYALAHLGLGTLLLPRYIAYGNPEDLRAGARGLRRALELDPSLGQAYALLAYADARLLSFDESLANARAGVEHDPSSAQTWYFLGACALLRAEHMRRPEQLAAAVRPLLRSVARTPGYGPAHVVLAALYAMRGEYGHATPLLDQGIAVEERGADLTFLGSRVLRGILLMNVGALDRAHDLITRAIEHYSSVDYVYGETMTSLGYWGLGRLLEARGSADQSLEAYKACSALAERHPYRLGVGAQWVKAQYGIARLLLSRGRTADAERTFSQALGTFHARTRFVWGWFIGCGDADVMYEQAATEVALGRSSDAFATLERAADAGWADITNLNHDPVFSPYREDPALTRIAMAAVQRVTLQPPVGDGGMPDLDVPGVLNAGGLAREAMAAG